MTGLTGCGPFAASAVSSSAPVSWQAPFYAIRRGKVPPETVPAGEGYEQAAGWADTAGAARHMAAFLLCLAAALARAADFLASVLPTERRQPPYPASRRQKPPRTWSRLLHKLMFPISEAPAVPKMTSTPAAIKIPNRFFISLRPLSNSPCSFLLPSRLSLLSALFPARNRRPLFPF